MIPDVLQPGNHPPHVWRHMISPGGPPIEAGRGGWVGRTAVT